MLLASVPYQKILKELEDESLKWLNVGEDWSCKKELVIISPYLKTNEVKEERRGRQVCEMPATPVVRSQLLEVLGQPSLSPCTSHFSREVSLVVLKTLRGFLREWQCVEPYHIRFSCNRGWKLVLLRSETQMSPLVSRRTLWELMWLVPLSSLSPCYASRRSRWVPMVAPTLRLLCCLFWEVEG